MERESDDYDKASYEEYKRLVLSQIEEEVHGADGLQGYNAKSFISRSKGRGRRTEAREVILIENEYTGKNIYLKGWEPKGQIDVWAEDAIGDVVPPGTDVTTEFLERLRRKAE